MREENHRVPHGLSEARFYTPEPKLASQGNRKTYIPVIQQNRKGDRSKREVKFVEIGSLVSPRSESQEERNEQRYNKAYHPRHMQR